MSAQPQRNPESEPKSRGGAHPTHEPDDKTARLVRQLSGLGVVTDDIARIVGISDVTVRKYYKDDLARGRAEANLQVARAMFRAATRAEPNITAGIFWLKNRAGWKDVQANAEQSTRLHVDFRWAEPETVTIEAEPAEPLTVTFETEDEQA